jgi:hypothetical protein
MSEIIAVVEYEENISVPQIGIQGLSASNAKLEQIQNVDASDMNEGSVLVYRVVTNKWTSTTTLDAQNMEGGHY